MQIVNAIPVDAVAAPLPGEDGMRRSVLGVDPRLRRLVASCGRSEAIQRARTELAATIDEIAAAIGCHPKTVRRRLAAVPTAS